MGSIPKGRRKTEPDQIPRRLRFKESLSKDGRDLPALKLKISRQTLDFNTKF